MRFDLWIAVCAGHIFLLVLDIIRIRMSRHHHDTNWDPLLTALAQIYQEVDEEAGRLAGLHAERLQCGRGCCSCCVDGLTVFEVEAENIRRRHPALLREGAPRAEGGCAFLDDAGACRIYPHRPYVCRTQGLPLRWIDEAPGEGLVELRDICPLNDEGASIESLSQDACWTIGPFEERLARLQARVDGGVLRRVSLRSLFHRDEPSP